MTTEQTEYDPIEYEHLPLPVSIITILTTCEPRWVYRKLIKDWPKLEGLSETLRKPMREWRP